MNVLNMSAIILMANKSKAEKRILNEINSPQRFRVVKKIHARISLRGNH